MVKKTETNEIENSYTKSEVLYFITLKSVLSRKNGKENRESVQMNYICSERRYNSVI